MAHYEVEVKTLLGEKEAADALLSRMHESDHECTLTSENSQLNHYFKGGDIAALFSSTHDLFSEDLQQKFTIIVEKGSDFSVRTRKRDGEVLLVVKASVDEGTSENTVARLEFEESVTLSLDELDALLLAAGYEYQAKWSRDRKEYAFQGLTVSLDQNAGYGYLAEFEQIVNDESELEGARARIDAVMQDLGVEELSQERLARMFEFYNANWGEYYGTDKTFTLE